MTRDDEFIHYIKELLAAAGNPSARRMFGGCGIYLDETIIGIVVDGRLYLKIDDDSRARFEAAGSEPFVYEGNGKPVEMSYWTAPDAALESAEAMAPWARLAQDAAQRKSTIKKKRGFGTKPKPKSLKAPVKPLRAR